MHARDLVEIGARVAILGPLIARGGGRIPRASAQVYWSAARCRIDRWTRRLSRHRDLMAAGGSRGLASWMQSIPLLEEALASELLSRTFTAAAAAYDARQGAAELEPIARSVLASHLEIRSRSLQALLIGERLALPEADRLNELRRKLERWCDMLLAHLAPLTDTASLAFDSERARDFVADLAPDPHGQNPDFLCRLVLSSLRSSFKTHFAAPSPNADLNGQIGRAVLSCFREEPFEPLGHLEPGWLERIWLTADDAQEMLSEIL